MPNGRPIPDPTPNNEPTASVRPSALTSRLVGYQLVGIRPRSVPAGRPYMATAFAPPSATNRVLESGDRATAVGARPILRSWNGVIAIDRTSSAAGSQHCLAARSVPRGLRPPRTETYATAPS